MGLCQSNNAEVSPSDGKSGDSKKKVKRNFKEIKVLGCGASCKVLQVKDKSSNQMFALKKLEKNKKDAKKTKESEHLWSNEVKVLKEVKHPNILEYVDSYETKDAYCLVTGFCAGGELFDKVVESEFSEEQAARLVKNMLTGIKHCHDKNIVHRDLKPENFVFEHSGSLADMKLIDFGCAVLAKDDQVIKDVAGSPYYVAPEVLIPTYKRTGKTWKASDLWSIGVILFLLVNGYPPFNGNSQDQIFHRIKRGRPPKFNPEIDLSDEVKDLILKLLVVVPSKRLDAKAALDHPWFASASATPLPDKVAKNIKNFQTKCKLKKAVGKAVVGQMSKKDHEILKEVFAKYDKNGDGHLDKNEISAMMREIGMNAGDADSLLNQYDDDASGDLDLAEFKNAHGVGMLKNEKVIDEVFNLVDSDGDGMVTAGELEEMLKISPDEAKEMIAEVDKDGNGTLDMEEWLQALKVERKKRKRKKK